MIAEGTVLAGYRIEGAIARGGMGVLYKATQLSLQRTVALKVLSDFFSDDEVFNERFRREGMLQAGIDHPHIVTVYEAGESEHGLFLAMRLIHGPNLKELILTRELDAERALGLLYQVATALDAAHEAGLIHRDIKPQNILVGPSNHAYLADFGVTKAIGSPGLTRTGEFMGTIDYLAPEQVHGEVPTTSSDIYALAGVLYECLSGVVPYPKATDAAVLFAHVTEPPPSVSSHRPELPAELDSVIAQGMSKNPAERHSSACALIEHAERSLTARRRNLPPPAPIESPIEAGIREQQSSAEPKRNGEPAAPLDSRRIDGNDADDSTLTPGAGAMAMAPPVRAKEAFQPASSQSNSRPGGETPGLGAGGPRVARPEKVRQRSGVVAAAAVLTLGLLGLAGYALGSLGEESGSSGSGPRPKPSPPSRRISANGVGVTAPGHWETLGDPKLPGIDFDGDQALSSDNAYLATGWVAGPARPLPPVLDRTLEGTPQRSAVMLGDTQAHRYSGLSSRSGEPVTVYAVPTNQGAVTLLCEATRPDFTAARCEDVVPTLRIIKAKPYSLGPNDDYAASLDSVMNKLNLARAEGRRKMEAAQAPPGQAGAASLIARAHGTAAEKLAQLNITHEAAPANDALVVAIRRARDSYAALSAAATKEDVEDWEAARQRAQKSEEEVRKRLRDLESLGYAVT